MGQPGIEALPDTVSFLLVANLKELRFNPRRLEPLEFESASPQAKITLRSLSTEESGSAGFGNLECKVHIVSPADPDVCTFVECLTEGRYVVIPDAPVTPPVSVKGEVRIAEDGRVLNGHRVPYHLYPKPVRKLVRSTDPVLRGMQDRFLRLLRWTQDISGPHELYDFEPALYWRRGQNGDHHPVSLPADERVDPPTGIDGIVWERPQQDTLRTVWDEPSTNEPLAHELLREAGHLYAAGAARSSLLMAATAIETGVKQHIAKELPENAWLLENMPSPPVHHLLERYLPLVHPDQEAIRDWGLLKPLWLRVQKLTTARNGTAHTGKPVGDLSLHSHLQTASDVLYLLDALGGQLWARSRVSQEWLSALDWPRPPENRIRVTVRMEEKWDVDR